MMNAQEARVASFKPQMFKKEMSESQQSFPLQVWLFCNRNKPVQSTVVRALSAEESRRNMCNGSNP